jgi:hypothetical protein
MIGFHTVGGLGYYTRNVLQYILARQTVVNWVLGDCDFTRQFEYGFEQENLLSAMFSVPTCFSQDYIWTYNMSTYPWIVNLKQINTTATPELYVRAAKNMLSLSKTSDPRNLCTRLYPFGYGEGVNQLNISEINGGQLYLQAPDSIIQVFLESEFLSQRRVFILQRLNLLRQRIDGQPHVLVRVRRVPHQRILAFPPSHGVCATLRAVCECLAACAMQERVGDLPVVCRLHAMHLAVSALPFPAFAAGRRLFPYFALARQHGHMYPTCGTFTSIPMPYKPLQSLHVS